jgi:CRP/FNR family transcriptional regulator, anaerobic regulatory protein
MHRHIGFYPEEEMLNANANPIASVTTGMPCSAQSRSLAKLGALSAAHSVTSYADAAQLQREAGINRDASASIASTLKLLDDCLTPQRRVVHAGDPIYQAGERFGNLHILHSGFVKIVSSSSDGREQVVGLKFRGDWLGFDGIAGGHYSCDAVAMDTGEVWTFKYADFLSACLDEPLLLTRLHQAMSREIAHDRDSLMSVCTLPADARVAEFLRYWAQSLAMRGLRTDHITLRMTRAEIGNYLGMTLETVSRALSKLARDKVIAFNEKGRREIHIPDVAALAALAALVTSARRTAVSGDAGATMAISASVPS